MGRGTKRGAEQRNLSTIYFRKMRRVDPGRQNGLAGNYSIFSSGERSKGVVGSAFPKVYRDCRWSPQISESSNRRLANYTWALHRRQEIPIRELRRGTVVNHRYLPTVSPAMHRNRCSALPIHKIFRKVYTHAELILLHAKPT